MESLSISDLLTRNESPVLLKGRFQYDEFPSHGDVSSALTLYLNDRSGFRLKGEILAELDLECDSCLEKFPRKVAIELDEQYIFSEQISTTYGKSGEQAIQINMNEVYEEIDEEGELDIKDLVRQMLLLETASKRVCGVDKCHAELYESWVEPSELEQK